MNTLESLLSKYESQDISKTQDHGISILVIDDDESMRRGLSRALSHKYNVVLAVDGFDGIAKLNKEIYSVILDVKMSKLDGFGTYSKLKEKHPEIPIIFYTAFQSEHDLQEVINKYKPEGYVEKGKDIGFLENILENAIKKYELVLENEDYKRNLERKVKERTEQLEAKKQEEQKQRKIAEKALERELKEREARINAEKDRALYEKMAAVGKLAFAYAHNMRNALSTISDSFSTKKKILNDILILLEMYIDGKPLDEITEYTSKRQINKRRDKLAAIDGRIDNSLALAYKRIISLENTASGGNKLFSTFQLDKLIDNVINDYEIQCAENGVTIIKDFQKADYSIHADEMRIYDSYSNLIKNAIEANSRNIQIKLKAENDNIISIFKDDGEGMDEDTKKNAFDIFSTTKCVSEDGSFRGVGLFSVWTTITLDHNGKIYLKSEPGKGTEYTILLHHNKN